METCAHEGVIQEQRSGISRPLDSLVSNSITSQPVHLQRLTSFLRRQREGSICAFQVVVYNDRDELICLRHEEPYAPTVVGSLGDDIDPYC